MHKHNIANNNRPSLSASIAQKDNRGAQPKVTTNPKLPPYLQVLVKRFPLAFNLNDRKPLKIGIYHDILAAFADDSSFSNNALKKALRYYVTGRGYLLAMVNSTTRIDLEGKVAGEINPEDRLHAEKCLAVKYSNAPTTEL